MSEGEIDFRSIAKTSTGRCAIWRNGYCQVVEHPRTAWQTWRCREPTRVSAHPLLCTGSFRIRGRCVFDLHRESFSEHTRLTADIKLPELTRDSFIDLCPLLPYQIDLIIQVVSGLRTQGGASKHVGGANRTIIKLAQQLLINPAVNLADHRSRP